MPAAQNGNGSSTEAKQTNHVIGFEVHSPDFHCPEDVVRYAREKVEHRLKKFNHHVHEVVIHLRDLNGPKGGSGLSCHIEARLPHMQPVNVEEEGTDLRAAIDLAIDRLDVVVGRHVSRARQVPFERGAKIARAQKLSND